MKHLRPRTLAALICLSVVTTACAPFELQLPPREQIARDAGDVVDATEIVALAPDSAAAGRLIGGAQARGYQVKRQDSLGGLGLQQVVFRVPQGRTPAAAIAELEALEAGTTAGVNHAYRLQAAPTGRRYAGEMLHWAPGGCPSRMPIGMIDGAVDLQAPSLQGAQIAQTDFTGGRPTAMQHGTAVAEILAGPGRLTGARLYNAAVISERGSRDEATGVDTLLRALDWLSESGVRLVNMSLAGPYNKILDRGIQAADRKGMTIIAAAGNTGAEAPPRYPAAFPQTIAVTALDAAMRPYDKAPRGNHIDFAAPGVDIFLTLEGQGQYLSGTSLAAPYVTAMIAGTGSGGSAETLRSRMARSARDLGASGKDPVFGYGLPSPAGACLQN